MKKRYFIVRIINKLLLLFSFIILTSECCKITYSYPVYVSISQGLGMRYYSDFEHSKDRFDFKNAPMIGFNIKVGTSTIGTEIECLYSRNYVNEWMFSEQYKGPYDLMVSTCALYINLFKTNNYMCYISAGYGLFKTSHKVKRLSKSDTFLPIPLFYPGIFNSNKWGNKISATFYRRVINNVFMSADMGRYYSDKVAFNKILLSVLFIISSKK